MATSKVAEEEPAGSSKLTYHPRNRVRLGVDALYQGCHHLIFKLSVILGREEIDPLIRI